jgi:hypothetical protein
MKISSRGVKVKKALNDLISGPLHRSPDANTTWFVGGTSCSSSSSSSSSSVVDRNVECRPRRADSPAARSRDGNHLGYQDG